MKTWASGVCEVNAPSEEVRFCGFGRERQMLSQSRREGEACLLKQPLKHADVILADNPPSEPPGTLLGCCTAHSEKSNPVPSKRRTETGRTATQTQSDSIFF